MTSRVNEARSQDAPAARALTRFLAPRYWGVWAGLAAMRLAAMLPTSVSVPIGRRLGRLSERLQSRRKQIAAQNIALCFPQMRQSDREDLLTRHFESLGLAFLEMAAAWWPESSRTVRHDIEGLEHLQRALARNRGVILLAGHFTTIEIGGALLALHADYDVLYRPFDNPLFDEVMRRRREVSAARVIARDDIRGMVRALKAGRAVLYMPDQADTSAQSAPADFFGIPAPTTTAPARLARMTGAAVVPFFPCRTADDRRYVLKICPALADFPGDDPRADAERINAVIEAQARLAPAQYLWVHRRFKGEPGRYDTAADGRLGRS